MKIKDIKIMRGPNYWSISEHKLIVAKIDLEQYADLSEQATQTFKESLRQLFPSLEVTEDPVNEHNAGNYLMNAICGIAVELQRQAGMDKSFSATYPTIEPEVYKMAFGYVSEVAGTYAAEAAVECAGLLLEGNPFDLAETVDDLKDMRDREVYGPSTQSIVDEARRRGIPDLRLNENSFVQLGYGAGQQLFRATVMGTTSSIGVDIAGSKWFTKSLLGKHGIPVPKGVMIESEEELSEAVEEVGFPVVIKPIDGNHGRGITANIQDLDEALRAFKVAHVISDEVIVENYIVGDDYRFLVINYKLIAVAKRTPAMVTGDGTSTIQQLIDAINKDPKRGNDHEQTLTKIKADRHTLDLLEESGLTLSSVVPKGQDVLLKRTANLSTGGTATDVTDMVHPANVFMAERIARLTRLDVCGIDIMAKDVTAPINIGNGAIIEVNAGPGFRMHTHPTSGQPRNVAKPVVDMLFPGNGTGRIPIVAITGTNGKTTTTRLISYLAGYAGFTPGYTTTEGIYINGQVVMRGDCSGPKSAELVLSDPSVDFAVLECARGGILRSGLAFDESNISIVTNISEDHLGLGDINTMDEYARVKEVVPKSTRKDGYTILNADDDRVYAMKDKVSCSVVLFSMDPENPRILDHSREGGMTITIEDGQYIMYTQGQRTSIIAVNDIPLTYEGTADFMVKNILPAIGAAFLSGISVDVIREALANFSSSPTTTPGRMNLFDFGDFKVMLDYAHNAAGFREVEKYMSTVNSDKKVGIIAATGDRKEEDILTQGEYAAKIFDEIIIRHDRDSRSRTNDQLTELLKQGIASVKSDIPVTVISDEHEAVGHAISTATPDTFIFACADNVYDSIEIIESFQRKVKK